MVEIDRQPEKDVRSVLTHARQVSELLDNAMLRFRSNWKFFYPENINERSRLQLVAVSFCIPDHVFTFSDILCFFCSDPLICLNLVA